MAPRDEMTEALAPVLDAFSRLGVAYRIGGSVASSALGVARSTLDVDLVANLQPAHARPLCELLGTGYYADETAVREAIERRSCFNAIHLATMIKIDVFILKTGHFDVASFGRCRRDALGALEDVAFCTAEDMILRKLQWYHDGGRVSERQWADVLGLLRVQRDGLDWTYLTHWASGLGLSDLLTQARAEAGTP